MPGSLGTIRGQAILDARQAIASYAALRAANATTIAAMRGSSAAFLGVSKATGTGALVLGAGFLYAIKQAAAFEKQLDYFGAVSASTVSQMEAVRAKALQLGKDTIFSANDIADSFVTLGKAGVSAELIITGVGDAVANLGAAADIPLTTAAEIMTAAVQSFSLSGRDAVRVADMLAGAANASIVDVQDLGVSLKYVGGVAHALGVPIDSVIDSLALLGKYGIRGSTAGTSLRQIMVSLTGTSKKATKQLKDLGIITKDGSNLFFDAAGKAKPLADIFQILQDKTKGLTQAQKLAAFKTIFNNRALAAALDLTAAGKKGFAAMNAEISKTTAAEVASKRLDNLSGDIEILKGNLQTLFIEAGGPMQEFFRGIVQGITKLVEAFINLSPATQQTILKIVGLTAAALAVMSIVTGLISIVFRFIGAMQRLGGAVRLLWAGLRIAAVAAKGFALALMANPVGLVIAAIIALIAIFVLLYKKNATFRAAVQAAGRAIVTAFKAVVAWFKGLPAFFSNLWNSITSGVSNAWNAITNFFTNTIPAKFKAGIDAIVGFFSGMVTRIVAFFQALPGRTSAIASRTVTGITSFFQKLPARVGYFIGFMIGSAVRLMITFYSKMFQIASKIVTSVINWFQKLPGRIAAFFSSLRSRAIALFNSTRSTLVSTASRVYSGVTSWIAKLPGRIAAFFASLRARAISSFNSARATLLSTASKIYSGITNFIAKLPGRVSSLFNSTKSRAISSLRSMLSSARSMASSIYSAIANGLARLPGAVGGIFGRVLSAFKAQVSAAYSAAQAFASNLWSGFKAGLGIHSPSFIERAMWQITGVLDDETTKMGRQVYQIQNLGSRLAETMVQADPDSVAQRTAQAVSAAAADLARLNKLQNSMAVASGDIRSTVTSRLPAASLAASQAAIRSASPNVIVQAPANESAPLIGHQTVYNPVAEPSSQTAVKQADRTALLGGRR